LVFDSDRPEPAWRGGVSCDTVGVEGKTRLAPRSLAARVKIYQGHWPVGLLQNGYEELADKHFQLSDAKMSNGQNWQLREEWAPEVSLEWPLLPRIPYFLLLPRVLQVGGKSASDYMAPGKKPEAKEGRNSSVDVFVLDFGHFFDMPNLEFDHLQLLRRRVAAPNDFALEYRIWVFY